VAGDGGFLLGVHVAARLGRPGLGHRARGRPATMNIDLWRVFIVWPVLCALPLFLGFAHALKRLGVGREDLLFPGVLLAGLGGVLIACLRLYFLERKRVRKVSQAP